MKDQSEKITSKVWGFIWVSVIVSCIFSGCATAPVVSGNKFIHPSKGYQLTLPDSPWVVDKDAWAHDDKFGEWQRWTRPKTSYFIQNKGDGTQAVELQARNNPRELEKREFVDVDFGLRNASGELTVFVGTVTEGRLREFSDEVGEEVQGATVIDDYYRTLIKAWRLPEGAHHERGQVSSAESLKVETDGYVRQILGKAIQGNYLFILFEDKGSSAQIEEGIRVASRMMDSLSTSP